ncbi:hypothetical protein C8R46DRAFT_1361909 [Mycena filopes]|nr:hypothetical protein C8R46DRAFT_1361909 [Mycena filopes]
MSTASEQSSSSPLPNGPGIDTVPQASYGGLLAQHSPVFEHMLERPPPADSEFIDGCPIVRLEDNQDDLESFLLSLFDYQFFGAYPKKTTFGILAGVTRLSKNSPGSSSWTITPGAEWVRVVVLAREMSLDWILPIAFYHMLENSTPSQLLNGVDIDGVHFELAPQDKSMALDQCQAIPGAVSTHITSFLLNPDHALGCALYVTRIGATTCTDARLKARREVELRTIGGTFPMDVWTQADWNEMGFCASCKGEMLAAHREARLLQPQTASIEEERGHELTKAQSHTLASLAGTCTKTSGIALDLLWAFQDTILHVLDCMPPGIWDKDGSVTRVIRNQDWQRSFEYNRRVRFLSWSDASLPKDINLAALCETLRLSLSIPHLFPNLRGITWTFQDPSSVSLVASLLTPTIATIALGKLASLPALTLLSTLAARCPLLRHVDLSQDGLAASQVDVVSSFIHGLKQIRHLRLAYLDAAGWDHLATLPSVEVLIIQALLSSPPLVAGNSESAPKFVSLRSLIIFATSSQNVMAVIGALSSRTVEQEHLSDSLVVLGLGDDKTASQSGPTATVTTIRPLLSFTNLFHVTLGASTGLDLDDDAVAAPIRTMLLSLMYLAEHCPKLGRLWLPVDTSVIPVTERTPSQHALYSWKAGDSAVASPLGLARFLTGLFPKLRSVHGNPVLGVWDTVQKIEILVLRQFQFPKLVTTVAKPWHKSTTARNRTVIQ